MPAGKAGNKETLGEPFILNGKQIPFSQAVRANGPLVITSGQVPFKDGKVIGETIEDQTRYVLNAIGELLRMAGTGMDNAVETTCIITDPTDFPGFNKVYAEFFPNNPPARTTFVAALLVPVKVEIAAKAVMPLTG